MLIIIISVVALLYGVCIYGVAGLLLCSVRARIMHILCGKCVVFVSGVLGRVNAL